MSIHELSPMVASYIVNNSHNLKYLHRSCYFRYVVNNYQIYILITIGRTKITFIYITVTDITTH